MANEEAWRAVGFTEDAVQEITELVRLDKLKAAQALVQSSWDDVNRRAVHTVEQSQAMDALAEQLREAGEAVAQHDITLRDDGVFVVRDRQGRVVDTAGTPEAAFELARAVAEREQVIEREREEAARADYEAWYEAELARRDAEVAGFEMEHERVEEAQADAQSRGEVLAEHSQGHETGTVITLTGVEVSAEITPKNAVQVARDWVNKNLRKTDAAGNHEITIHRESFGPVRVSGKSFAKLRAGMPMQPEKVQLLPAIKPIIEQGQYEGKRATNKPRKDGIVAFHSFVGDVELAGKRRAVRVLVGEDAQGNLVYDLYSKKSPLGFAQEGSSGAKGDEVSESVSASPSYEAGEALDAETYRRTSIDASDRVNIEVLNSPVESASVLGSPLQPNRPNAARVSFEGEAAEAGTALAKRKKPVSAPEVMGALAKVIEAVGGKTKGMFRTGNAGAGQGFLGHYRPVSQITRIAITGDIATAAHELAHALDALLFKPYTHWEDNRLGLSDEARAELYKLGKQLYGKRTPANGYHSEGFAEFVRLWFTDREQANEKAAQFAAWMEGKLGEEPELAKAMAQAQALAHRYLRQGAEARADSGIVATPTTLEKAGAMTRQQRRDFYKNWIEAAVPIQKMVEEAARRRGVKELPAELDPFLTLTARRMTADAVVRNMATKGMVDFAGRPTGGPALADAFALVKGKVRKFVIYLWAKRTIALHDDPIKGPRNSGLAIEDARHLVQKYESDHPQFVRAARDGVFVALEPRRSTHARADWISSTS